MKKLLSIFLSIAILFVSLSIGVTSYAQSYKGYEKNPFYTGEKQTKNFSPLNASRLNSSTTHKYNGDVYYPLGDSLYKILRNALGKRNENVHLRLYSNYKIYNFREVANDLFKEATEDKISISSTDGDYARWSVCGYTWDTDYTHYGDGYYYNVDLKYQYYSTSSQEQMVDNKINSIVNDIRKKNYSDYETIKYVHDLICDSTTYDYAAAQSGDSSKYDYSFTAYGALCKGLSVCQGYANAFYRICKELGYNVRFVSSDPNQGCHAWNLIQLDDKYYFVDSTWDDEIRDDWEVGADFDDDGYFYFLIDYNKLRSEDSFNNEHTLYNALYNDSYYNNNFKNKTSSKPYDYKTAKGFSTCVISLSQTNFKYTGDKVSPQITITDADGNIVDSYSLEYSNRVQCGRVRVKIIGKDEYAGYETYRTYIITPSKMTNVRYVSNSRTSSSLAIAWNKYSGANGYQIQQYKDGEWKLIRTVGDVSTTNIKGLSPSKNYKFRVRAFVNINNYKYYSEPSNALASFTKPKKVSSLSLSTKSKAINVKWKKVACSGYEIQYSKGTSNMSKAKKVTVSSSATLKKLKNLKKGKKYYVRIRAYKKVDGKKYYSEWSSKKHIKVK